MPFILNSQFNFRQWLPQVPREERWELAICVFIAFIFWLVISLTTKEHSVTKPVEVSYVVSEDKVLLSPPTNMAEATISGPGWELMWSNFFQPTIKVSLYRGPRDSKVITQVDISALVSKALYSTETNLDKLIFLPVTLQTEDKTEKRLPVRPLVSINFAEGYQARYPLVVEPDSVTVWGAPSILDSLSFWPTDSLQLEDVDNSFQRIISLGEASGELKLALKEVTISQKVEVFTEKELYVRVEVVNPPAKDSFSIFPGQVRLKIGVLQSNYNSIVADSFRLVADLNGMRTEDGRNSIPLTLQARPRAAISVTYTPRVAEYFFFKKE
jgi:hypothetical protein